MLMNFLGLLSTFVLASWFSAGITLAPVTVVWSSIWVYITFALCLIPGYLIAWLILAVCFGLLALLGAGAAVGGAVTFDALQRKRKRF